ncbi:MAG: carboxypeptidase-like regulatory domain-containing protein [Burkholderiales bacterium]|nr:carboxypeptidase-like regulatory domain-containing protein [Burkholderiales bacterium]
MSKGDCQSVSAGVRAVALMARLWRASVLSLALAGTALVFGAPADLVRGLAWLQAQVLSDGGLAAGAGSASLKQSQCETAATLLKLAGNSSRVATLLSAIQPTGTGDPTESVACWQHLRQQLGQDILGADLESRRIAQQGYGAYDGFAVSSAGDTGWALSARLQNLSATEKGTLLAWLQSTQAADGSFATANQADLLATAIILRGLKDEAPRNSAAAAIGAKAAQWLLGRRNAQGNWLGDVAITSVVFEAVHPYTGTDPAIASGVEAFLLSQQGADGSWQGDTFATAVALRALALVPVAPVDPTLAFSATVKGVATLASSGQPLAGVSITAQPSTGPARSAVTDAQGSYILQGIPPGNVGLTASLAGYQTVAGQVALASGAVAVFSPAMFAPGETPATGARVKGTVKASGSNAPLAGVVVQVAGASNVSAQTDAQGSFDVAVAAGSNMVSFSLAGYLTQDRQVLSTNGSIADVGSVLMRTARLTSTLRGVVTDLAGQPVAGAIVRAGAAQALTNGGGAYALTEIGELQFSARASASGYVTREVAFNLAQPGDLVQDFTLPAASADFVDIAQLVLSVQSAGLRQDVTATAVLSNPSSQPASAVATAVVANPDGKRIANLAATDALGNLLGAVALAPGQQRTVHFKWNTGAYAPGSYRITARAQLPGSVLIDKPDGVILASIGTELGIQAGASFIGSLTANPPVLRARADTPVKLSAVVRNDGNVTLPAQGWRVAIIDAGSGETAHTQTLGSAELRVAQVRDLVFADWTPAGTGNFRLELTAPSTPGPLATTTLYVGAASSATFSVDKSWVPAGTQSVRGTIDVTGPGAAGGAVGDPLEPLVRKAITNAVRTVDALAYQRHLTDLPCFACHVQTQAVVGGETSLRYVQPLEPLKRTVLLNSITHAVRGDGSILHNDLFHGHTNTMLGLWAATQWHDSKAVALSNRKMADWLMAQQDPGGTWSSINDAGWWGGSQAPQVGLTVGSLRALRASMQRDGAPPNPVVTRVPVDGLPSGEMRFDAGPDGTLYIAHVEANQVLRIRPGASTAEVLVANIPSVRGVRVLPDGRLAIAAISGIYLRDAAGTVSRISTQFAWDVQPYGDGRLLVTDGNWTLYSMDYNGNLVELMNVADSLGALVRATVVQPDGTLLVTTYNRYGRNPNVLQYSPTGQLLSAPVPIAYGSPYETRPYGDGHLVSTGRGLFLYDKNWVGQSLVFDYENAQQVRGHVQMPDGRLLVNMRGEIYELKFQPMDAAAFQARMNASVEKSAAWLKAASAAASPNNVDMAFRLIGLGNAKAYYAGTPRASEFDSLMQSVGSTLRSRQRASGGWVWCEAAAGACKAASVEPDAMVTAIVGFALDYLDPSKSSPEVRKAVQYLLEAQLEDGTWKTELATGQVMGTAWVEIWLPVALARLGTIEAALELTLPANVVMSNPDIAPSASSTAADGSTTYRWDKIDVTESPRQVNFNLVLQDMQVDEVRAVASSANLVFANTFVEGTVSAPIEIPKVAVGTNLTQTVGTGKPVYTELEQVVFTATIFNGGDQVRDALVRFTVLDSAGRVTDVLPQAAAIGVPASGSNTLQAVWPVTGVLSGSYQVKAELLSPAGTLYATSMATFTVTASTTQPSSARINADRLSYNAAQDVLLTARVANLTSNVLQENLRVVTTVAGPTGQVIYSRTESVEQLAAGLQRQWGYTLPASGLAVGSHTASVELLDAQDRVLSQGSASFTVQGVDQTGVGLAGQMQAPATALTGQTFEVTLTATHQGNAPLPSVPVTIRIVDPQAGVVLASTTQTFADWVQGTAQSMTYSWTAQGLDGQVVVAMATALVAGREVLLGQASVRLVGIPLLRGQPALASFAPIYPGESAQQTITVTSVGTRNAAELVVSLAGAAPSQYVVTGGTCMGLTTLAINASCTLIVSYRPQVPGTHAGELRVASAGASPLVVPLSGDARPVVFAASVSAGAAEVEAGQAVALNYSLANPSTAPAAMAGTLAVRQADGHSVASWPLSITVAGSSSHAGNQTYTAGENPQTLTVVLSQQVGTSTVVLGTTTFVVTDPPVPLAVTANQTARARILVLVSCPVGSPPQDDAACVAQRSSAILSYFASLGASATVVASAQDFIALLRCGTYNTYWISGGAAKLAAAEVGELRQTVYRGDALWMDGVHDSRNQLLHDVAGVRETGKLPQDNQVIQLAEGGLFAAGPLATLGQPTTFELAGGAAQALFSQLPGNQSPAPALVSNAFGQGRSLLFAFDLAGMIALDASAADAPLRGLAGAAIAHAVSESAPLTLGDLSTVHASVTNQGSRTVSLSVTATLPAGLAPLQASGVPQLTPNADGSTAAVWTFSLTGGATAGIEWLVRADAARGYSVPIQVHSLPAAGGTAAPRLRESTSASLEVLDAAALLHGALSATQALEPSDPQDKIKRTKALDAVMQALGLHSQGQYEAALANWMEAASELEKIGSADTSAARLAVALAIEASSDALCFQRCGNASCQ